MYWLVPYRHFTNGTSYKHYQRFYDYYGDYDYADKWVSAALAGTDMAFATGKHGPNDFATLGDMKARIEAVKKGTHLILWRFPLFFFSFLIP